MVDWDGGVRRRRGATLIRKGFSAGKVLLRSEAPGSEAVACEV